MNFVDFLFDGMADPQKMAIIDRAGTLSYARLSSAVNALTKWLRETRGLGQHMILISENSPFFVIAYLSIIKSGNVCVPLNPAITESTLKHIIGQCSATTGFLHPKVDSKYGSFFQNRIGPQFVSELPEGPSEVIPGAIVDGARIAEIIFTSGSTALPKGVMLSHNNLRANTESIVDYLGLDSDDRVAAVLPFYYCYGLSLLHTHLRAGASMVLNNTFMMLNTVIDDIQRHECTGFAGVPSHFQIMLRKSRKFKEAKFPTLRYVTQAGGRLPNAFIKEFIDLFPDIAFYVMYGQTEATSRLSYLPPDLLPDKMGSIGKGIPGVTLAVVDEGGEPVAPGDVGQIVAQGGNVMVGYFDDPELTAETVKDGKLFTGDIGTVDEDGFIYIVAREKEFIKVGGERVSPREIEEVITAMAEVVDCSIVGVEDDLTGEAILAYVVLSKNAALTEKEIVTHCNRQLSSEKVPKFVEFVDTIAMSETGKKILQSKGQETRGAYGRK